MTSAFKPEGYPSLSPYLITSEASQVIAFVESALGGETLRLFLHDDGAVMHAEVRIDDSVVMIGGAAGGWPASPAHVHLYVPDVDATYAAAIAAGGEAIQEPVQKDDPDRRGGVKDPGGNTWWISTQVGT